MSNTVEGRLYISPYSLNLVAVSFWVVCAKVVIDIDNNIANAEKNFIIDYLSSLNHY